jgi:phosphatidylglycerophosphatase A
LKINLAEKTIGSGLFTGYIPIASGTFGSLAALIIYYLIPGFEKAIVLIPIIIIFGLLGIKISDKFEANYGSDPSECTIDEMVGTWVALLFLKKEFIFVIIAFFIWRVLDIIKPFPANKAESLPGGWGIMLDDIISGLYTLIIMQFLVNFLFTNY